MGQGTLRCALCRTLLCRGEGVRRKRYGILCLGCSTMTRASESHSQLTQAMIDARDRATRAKSHCERRGACQLRQADPPVESLPARCGQ